MPYIVNGERISNVEYERQKYDDLRVRVPKGKREIVADHVAQYDKSINSFINRAIDETMERDKKKASE